VGGGVSEALRRIALLKPQEVADCLRSSTSFVYSEIKADRLAAVKIGGRIRIRMRDLEDYLRRHEVRPHNVEIDIDAIIAQVR
jgi:excisionase family DNA binding protein